MAFIKVLSVALCLSVSSAAPQYAQQLVRTVPAATTAHLVQAAPAATVVRSHPSSVLRHTAAPSVVRLAQPATIQTIAQPVQHTIVRAAPTVVAHHVVEEEEVVHQADASYNFGYSVADASSGDSKTREETREGDVVRGSYSVADPDGRIRVVEYTADAVNGFQATVTYDGEPGPVAIPFNAPEQNQHVVAAAPAQTVIAARTEPVASHLVHAPAATTVVRTAAAPQTLVHTVAQPAVVRASPATTVVRTAAVPQARHVLHNVAQPTVVRAAPATTVVRTAAAPQARHVLHNVAQPTILRAATTTQALHHVAQPTFVRAFPASQQVISHAVPATTARLNHY